VGPALPTYGVGDYVKMGASAVGTTFANGQASDSLQGFVQYITLTDGEALYGHEEDLRNGRSVARGTVDAELIAISIWGLGDPEAVVGALPAFGSVPVAGAGAVDGGLSLGAIGSISIPITGELLGNVSLVGLVLHMSGDAPRSRGHAEFPDRPPASPAVDGSPYSPREVSRRQSELRRRLETGNLDPDSPIPTQEPGRDLGGHPSTNRPRHTTGERDVASGEEHSRVPKRPDNRGGGRR